MKYLCLLVFILLVGCSKSYDIYQYDNGDDYVQDGMRRIIDKSTQKIGYESADGKVLIEPQFAFGYPFKNGVAKVTYEGYQAEVPASDNEYHYWKSERWFYIDKQGNQVKK